MHIHLRILHLPVFQICRSQQFSPLYQSPHRQLSIVKRDIIYILKHARISHLPQLSIHITTSHHYLHIGIIRLQILRTLQSRQQITWKRHRQSHPIRLHLLHLRLQQLQHQLLDNIYVFTSQAQRGFFRVFRAFRERQIFCEKFAIQLLLQYIKRHQIRTQPLSVTNQLKMLIHHRHHITHVLQKQATQIFRLVNLSRRTKRPFQLLLVWQAMHIFPKSQVRKSISQLQIPSRQEFHHRLNISLIKSPVRHNHAHRLIQPSPLHCIKHPT